MVWAGIKNELSEGYEDLKENVRDTANVVLLGEDYELNDPSAGGGTVSDIDRRKLLVAAGSTILGWEGLKRTPNLLGAAANQSPYQITRKDSDAETPTDPEEDSKEINYVEEICDLHGRQEQDVQDYIEDILGAHRNRGRDFYDIEVDGSTMRFGESNIGSMRIDGNSINSDQFGAERTYARLLNEAYNENQDQFVEGLEEIYAGECR